MDHWSLVISSAYTDLLYIITYNNFDDAIESAKWELEVSNFLYKDHYTLFLVEGEFDGHF